MLRLFIHIPLSFRPQTFNSRYKVVRPIKFYNQNFVLFLLSHVHIESHTHLLVLNLICKTIQMYSKNC
jgi:hypothetical protein